MTEPKRYRVMLPDQFWDIDTTSEEEAIASAARILEQNLVVGTATHRLDELGFIAWETTDA